jgi:hypothetical protein
MIHVKCLRSILSDRDLDDTMCPKYGCFAHLPWPREYLYKNPLPPHIRVPKPEEKDMAMILLSLREVFIAPTKTTRTRVKQTTQEIEEAAQCLIKMVIYYSALTSIYS